MSGPVFAEDAQRALEDRAAALAPGADLGTPDDWTLEVGGHRLLLVPATGEWLRHDRVHDTWEPTGHRAGEVRFGVVDGVLGARRTSPAPPLGRFCASCGTATEPGARFCAACGAPLV